MATEIQLRLITEGLEKAQADIDKLEKSIRQTKEEAAELNNEGQALDGVFSAFGSNAVSDFQSLRKSGTDLLKNFQTLRTGGIKGLVSGFRSMGNAIAATGIGFLLTKVPELASALSTLYDELTGVNDALREAESIRDMAAGDAIQQEFNLAALRLQRFEKTEENLREEQRLEMEILDAKIRAAEADTENYDQLFRLLNERSLKELEHENQISDFRAAKRAEEEAQAAEDQAKRDAERAAELAKEQEQADALAALQAQARQREFEERQDFEAQLAQMEEEAYLRTLSDEERELLAAQDKYFQLITEAENFNMDTAFLEEEKERELQEIRDRYADERREKELADQAERDGLRDEDLAKEKDRLEDMATAHEALQDAKLEALRGGIAVGQMLAGENEQVQNAFFIAEKAVAAGEVIINGIREKSQNAVQAAQFGMAFGAAAPAATTAMLQTLNAGTNLRMATSLATLAATTFAHFRNGGASASTGSDASTGSVSSVAAGSPEQQTLTPITGEGVQTTEPQPVQAYVVGQQITDQQALDSELRLRSTL